MKSVLAPPSRGLFVDYAYVCIGIRVSEKVPSIRVYSVPSEGAPVSSSSRGDDADGIRVR